MHVSDLGIYYALLHSVTKIKTASTQIVHDKFTTEPYAQSIQLSAKLEEFIRQLYIAVIINKSSYHHSEVNYKHYLLF
jgi:hypothetical protein